MRNNLTIKYILPIVLLTGVFPNTLLAQDIVDATSMSNKVMAGYQGWFRTPGDSQGNKGWAHLFNGPVPAPERLAFDTWPDMSELTKKEKYAVPGFSYADGSKAYLYSAQNYSTVLRHFQWMKEYGLDGVWLSEFCGHFPGGGSQSDSTTVLNIMKNVQKAAKATGRTWAFMWDMSGLSARQSRQQVFDIIINQWKKMVDEGVTADDRYMHDHEKPVLLIWGFFPSRAASQPDYMNPVIDFLLAPGKYQATLVAGVDPNWRSAGTPEFQAMLMRMQALQPWSVGRRVKDPGTGYAIQNTSLWEGDIEKCKTNHVMFMPVFNAGTHIAGPPPTAGSQPTVPRRTGNYLWEQFAKASHYGLNSAFVAMFDEINEGTQIMKIDIHPPVQAAFFTYDGATSDYYLRLIGAGARLLRSGKPVAATIPISPFDSKTWYQIKNQASGELLSLQNNALGLLPASKQLSDFQLWQIDYDGAGYFRFKNKATGEYIDGGSAQGTFLSSEANSIAASWRLEWDGSGACRMLNQNSHDALALTKESMLSTVPDTTNDALRWQILPQ